MLRGEVGARALRVQSVSRGEVQVVGMQQALLGPQSAYLC
jgi:hypothetical protein